MPHLRSTLWHLKPQSNRSVQKSALQQSAVEGKMMSELVAFPFPAAVESRECRRGRGIWGMLWVRHGAPRPLLRQMLQVSAICSFALWLFGFTSLSLGMAIRASGLMALWGCETCEGKRAPRSTTASCRGPDGRAAFAWGSYLALGTRALEPNTQSLALQMHASKHAACDLGGQLRW